MRQKTMWYVAAVAMLVAMQTGCINLVWSPSRCQCKDGKCCSEPPLSTTVGNPPPIVSTPVQSIPAQAAPVQEER